MRIWESDLNEPKQVFELLEKVKERSQLDVAVDTLQLFKSEEVCKSGALPVEVDQQIAGGETAKDPLFVRCVVPERSQNATRQVHFDIHPHVFPLLFRLNSVLVPTTSSLK